MPTERPPKLDLTGQRFYRLVAISCAGTRGGNRIWKCLCDCGNTVTIPTNHLRSGHTQSCGCYGSEKRNASVKTHGLRKTPEYEVWARMRRRCNNPHEINYERYGGRGIIVCERWNSFEKFLEDIGKRPTPNHSIDRIDNNGNYEPSNCRWATIAEQANNKRNNRLLTYKGKTMTMAQWALETGIKRGILANRLNDGWAVERTLTEPVNSTRTSTRLPLISKQQEN